MIVGWYSLDLYCDNKDVGTDGHSYKQFPKTYSSEFGSTARREARSEGWILDREKGTAICPNCSREARAKKRKAP